MHLISRDCGRGGADLTVDGGVERQPGPDLLRSMTLHQRNSTLTCALCDAVITIAEWLRCKKDRHSITISRMKPDGNVRKWLTQKMPDVNWCDDVSVPDGFCVRHLHDLIKGRTANLEVLLPAAKVRLAVSASDRARCRSCDGKRCWMCKRTQRDANMFGKQSPRPQQAGAEDAADFKSIEPTRRAPWSHRRWAKAQAATSSGRPSLSSTALLSAGQEAKLSTLRLSVLAKSMGGHLQPQGVSVASPANVRRDATRRNKLFVTFFECIIVDVSISPNDSAVYSCVYLRDFVEAVIFIRGKAPADVALFRISADGGRGDLKASFQIIYKDDSVFHATTKKERKRQHEALDAGVARTFIVSLINGATESYAAVSKLFDMDWRGVKALLPDASFVFPADMKIVAVAVGLGPSGCANEYIWSLWSRYTERSRPDVRRTIASIIEHNAAREEAEQKSGKSASDIAIDFGSVYHSPIALCTLFQDVLFGDFFVPPQLHIILGVAKLLYDDLVIIDDALAAAFLAAINVRHDDRHGRSGFVGNDSRKIFASHARLAQFVPRRKHHEAPQISEHRRSVMAIVAALRAFDIVISRTMSVHLHPEWRSAISDFAAAYNKVAEVMNRKAPRIQSLRRDRLTPKLWCLFDEVVAWIDRHERSLLIISEQSFESLHYAFEHFARNFKIPRTGASATTVRRSKKRKALRILPTDGVHTPSDGTRTGGAATRKKQRMSAVKRKSLEMAKTISFAPPEFLKRVRAPLAQHLSSDRLIGDVTRARRARMQALVAFNVSRLPVSVSCQARVKLILDWHESGRHGVPPWKSCTPPV